MGIGSPSSPRLSAGPKKHMDVLGQGMADGCRPPGARLGQGGAQHQLPDPGPGTRPPSPRSSPRSSASPRRHPGPPRRHRPHAFRPRHLRQPLDAGVRRGRRRRRPQGARQGAPDRGRNAGDIPRRPRLGEGPVVRQGRPRRGASINEIAEAAYGEAPLPEGLEGGLDGQSVMTLPTSPIRVAPTSASWTSIPTQPRSSCGGSSPSTTAGCGSIRWSSTARSRAAWRRASGSR